MLHGPDAEKRQWLAAGRGPAQGPRQRQAGAARRLWRQLLCCFRCRSRRLSDRGLLRQGRLTTWSWQFWLTEAGERKMASIRKEILTNARPDDVWDALRDIGALHTRLVPGFVTDTRLEPGARVVTFGNGIVASELIVTIDDDERRGVWSGVGGPMTAHNAPAQVFSEAKGLTKVVWIAHLLPNEAAGRFSPPSILQEPRFAAAKASKSLGNPCARWPRRSKSTPSYREKAAVK